MNISQLAAPVFSSHWIQTSTNQLRIQLEDIIDNGPRYSHGAFSVGFGFSSTLNAAELLLALAPE